MVELISVPLKKPSEVDIVKPLQNLIQSTYSTADKPQDYTDAINELNKLRNTAIWRAFDKYESSLEIIYSYYDEISALEGKIPANEVQIPFKWKDAFDKGSLFGGRQSLTISSLSYEKVCVLFNIAALQSAVAASQILDSDEGLKLSAKLFQQAAGIFHHLKNTVMGAVQQDPTPDLNPETLQALYTLMLAQAQEIFVTKSIHDNMKDGIIAKLCCQCEELFAEALKVFQKENLKVLWDKEWIPLIAGKQGAYHALTEFYQSLVCKANKKVGEEITRLEQASQILKSAQLRSGQTGFFEEFMSKIQRNLAEARKDNDFIYHERIPDIKSLEPVGKAMLAKMIPMSDKLSTNYKDLFANLVPVAVHQALAAYDLRKNEIVNSEITRLRESTQMLNSVLASLNLPAAIEVTKGSDLPQSLIDKASAVSNEGGVKALQTLITELPDLLKRNRDILDECERLLNEEKESDDKLRKQFENRWTRTPSDRLTEMFRSNIAKYRQIINNAVAADQIVKEKFDKHLTGMELLSKPLAEIESAVPQASGNLVECSAVETLRKLMEEVETIKAERDVIEHELKSATIDMKAKFLHALGQDGVINESALSVESLGKVFGPLQKQVKESLERQEKLIADIQNANSQFVRESGAGTTSRDVKMKELAAAHDAFTELKNNLQEGTSFYNNLTQLLVSFQNKVSDYCFARKTEKEELLKDLTQESSRQSSIPSPSIPTHHNPNVPTTTAPGSSGTLPYPVYNQGMPIPYGATASAPYPTYMPPPMPQGYNPYGTIPYPSSYNYPGGFPQAPGYPGNSGFPGAPGSQPGGSTPGYPYPNQQQQPPKW